MLRLLIGTGALLMAVGFGAAGWQYWKTMPRAAPVTYDSLAIPSTDTTAPVLPKAGNGWLISPTGGLIPQDDVRNYLAQDRFVPGRILVVERQASLTSLLGEGEKLPDTPFLEVLADIRAPQVAEGLCTVLTTSIAQDCAVNAARVVKDSVDPAADTAMFRLELVYRLKDSEADLPDLAAHVLQSDTVSLNLEPEAEGTASPDAALQAAIAAATAACEAETVGEVCRPMRFDLDWVAGRPVSARVRIAWLDPLPKGMFVAPPLDTASGG